MIKPDWSLAVAAAIFLVALFSLHALLFRPLLRVLDERKARTVDLRQQTRGLLERQQALLADCQIRIKEERQLGFRLADTQRADALKVRQGRIQEARAAAENALAKAREQVQAEQEAARAQLGRDCEEIAGVIAARVLERD